MCNENSSPKLGHRKLHRISWNKLMLPRDMRGLGLVTLDQKNLSFLTKHCLKLNYEKHSLWRNIVTGKYGERVVVQGAINVQLQKKGFAIMQIVFSIFQGRAWNRVFSGYYSWLVGDGQLIVGIPLDFF